MKIARIDHVRCQEASGYTYVWIPDNWTHDDLAHAVRLARDAYLKDLATYQEAAKNYSGGFSPYSPPKYASYPDMKVSEVTALWEEKKQKFNAWKAKHDLGYRSFAGYLTHYGCVTLHDNESELTSVENDWGHHHGLGIATDETVSDSFPSIKDYVDVKADA